MCTVRAGARRDRRVMGDDQQARAGRAGALEQQVDDPGAGRAVEVAGRLVGQQQARARRGGAGDRHALLLAARQLRRIMVQAMAKPDRLQFGRGARRARRSTPASSSGTATFSIAVIVGSRWNDCRMIPSDAPAQPRQLVLVERRRGPAPASATLPAVGPLEPGDDRHQRALARPRRAEHRDALAGVERQADRFEDVGADLALAEGQADVGERRSGDRSCRQ